MEKEIKILIGMCLGDIEDHDIYTPSELATFLNLKYTEGIYPYLKKLQEKKFIEKIERSKYLLNKQNHKVQDILSITKIFGKKAEILFTRHAKRVLEKFSEEPMLRKSKLPRNSLALIKDIASNTKIIHPIGEKYFITSWEETTKRILDFFDIQIKFDEEEFKHRVTKYYSSIPNTESPLDDTQQIELKELNLQSYLLNRDYILDKLKESDFSSLSIVKVLTETKIKEYSNNLFEITSKINDWKMKYIYNTDKIEGNPLTMQEVKTILTTGGLSVESDKKAVLETTNSRTALDNIFDTNNELSIEFVKKLHLATQVGIDSDAGKYKKKENSITDSAGALVDTTTPVDFVETRMNSLRSWYSENAKRLHPLVVATVFHNQFVHIHPFNDGNGRVARLLFNFILIKNGLFPIIFYNDEKERYYAYLRAAKSGDIKQFVNYSMELYRTQLDEF
ncbi:MAG: Fic family protein [Candidatus Micrarchaeales archaeon]